MPKQTSGSKKCGRGGSPKKAIKRLRRKAIATLREARLTAQLELVAAQRHDPQIRAAHQHLGTPAQRRSSDPSPHWQPGQTVGMRGQEGVPGIVALQDAGDD